MKRQTSKSNVIPLENGKDKKSGNNNVYFRRIVNDPIHGHIELHPLIIAIIDTPEFQRLRNLKQIGLGYLVFPGAMHSRFEHSLGVSHLGRRLLEAIASKQPELCISNLDILCVELASLCHDLGHGPFSHFFEHDFLPLVGIPSWRHEDNSAKMLQYLIDVNNLQPTLRKYGLNDNDVMFIKELIVNKPNCNIDINIDDYNSEEWPWVGRSKDKSFLYDIVSNMQSGMDVDKFDYLTRDAYYHGIPINFDYQRLIKFMRVINVNGRRQICIRDKEIDTVYELFASRAKLFRQAYFHKTTHSFSLMLADALKIADNEIIFPSSDGTKEFKLSETINDMYAFSLTNDSIIDMIRISRSPKLAEARNIIDNMMLRNIYVMIDKVYHANKLSQSMECILKEICDYQKDIKSDVMIYPNLLKIDSKMVHFGMKDQDPIEKVWFFNKSDINKPFKIPRDKYAHSAPKIFGEYMTTLYCTVREHNLVELAKKCFDMWRLNAWTNDQLTV